MSSMKVPSRIHDYEVSFGSDTGFVGELENIPNRLWVIDANVWRLHRAETLAGVDEERVLFLEVHEGMKDLEGARRLYDELMARGVRRNTTLVTVGGGIVQDVTGFVASTLYRGLRWVFVPTTLLAQADSCIGAKTSLNHAGFKNLLGTFYPPHAIHLSTSFLATLSELDFFSGLGEVIKLHLMGGRARTDELLASWLRIKAREPAAVLAAIRASLDVKVEYFKDDEFDNGRRNLLNYGHCFGHALESTSDFAIPHGQAVILGMMFANRVATSRGLLAPDTSRDLEARLLKESIIRRPTGADLDPERLFEAMKKDKKRVGEGLPLVMMTDGWQMTKVDNLGYEMLASTAARLAAEMETLP